MIGWREPSTGGRANSVAGYLVRWNSTSRNLENVLSANISNLQSNTLYTVIVRARGNDSVLGAESSISVPTSKRDAWSSKLLQFCLSKK